MENKRHHTKPRAPFGRPREAHQRAVIYHRAIRVLAVVIWGMVAAVDVCGDLQPPPEPVRLGREAWEL